MKKNEKTLSMKKKMCASKLKRKNIEISVAARLIISNLRKFIYLALHMGLRVTIPKELRFQSD